MMLGSIPQQDVFQRVMSAKRRQGRHPRPGDRRRRATSCSPSCRCSSSPARCSSCRSRPTQLLKDDPQKVLPTWCSRRCRFVDAGAVLRRAAVGHQVHRIGHAAGAVATFAENIWRQFLPAPAATSSSCWRCASRCWCSARCVLAYAIRMQGTPIYEMVSGAYQVHAGRRLRAAGGRPVLEARHHAGRDAARSCWASALARCSWPRPGARRSRRSWPACWRPCVGMVVGSLGAAVRWRNRARPHRRASRPTRQPEARRRSGRRRAPIIRGFLRFASPGL